MFVAKFNQVSVDSKFEDDKNGNLPFIGTVIAGKSTGTFINGTIFLREGLKEGKAYLCQNIEEEYEGEPQVRVQIIMELGFSDLMQAQKELGKPVLDIKQKAEDVEEEDDVEFETKPTTKSKVK